MGAAYIRGSAQMYGTVKHKFLEVYLLHDLKNSAIIELTIHLQYHHN